MIYRMLVLRILYGKNNGDEIYYTTRRTHSLPFLSFLAQLENKKIKKDLMWILFYKGAILKILVLDSLAEELCFAYITIK